MASRGYILTFHSHNVSGNTYETNDHVALDATLSFLERKRIPIVRVLEVARRLATGTFDALPERFACVTFDDGSEFDWQDIEHPRYGRQRSMFSILRSHSRSLLGLAWLRRAHATSFVIASGDARREISAQALGDDSMMTDKWWQAAQASGLMDIGSHGWHHVHPAVSEVRERPDMIERFDRVATKEDARLHIDRAFSAIRERAGGDSAAVFAYPYGQVSDFLADHYLPNQDRIIAAVAAHPQPVVADTDRWRIPRYVCGPDWHSEEGLEKLVAR